MDYFLYGLQNNQDPQRARYAFWKCPVLLFHADADADADGDSRNLRLHRAQSSRTNGTTCRYCAEGTERG